MTLLMLLRGGLPPLDQDYSSDIFGSGYQDHSLDLMLTLRLGDPTQSGPVLPPGSLRESSLRLYDAVWLGKRTVDKG